MLGLALVLAFFALLILLPLTTSARVLRVSRELDEMRERIARLEALSSGAIARATTTSAASACVGRGREHTRRRT